MICMMPQLFGFAILLSPCVIHAEPELAPAPREVERSIRIDTIKSGYQITLTREGSELVRKGLTLLDEGKPLADVARLLAKRRNDPELDKQIDFLTFVMKSQAPAIRKALDEKTGPNGAIIKVLGIEKNRLPDKPLLKALGEAFLPEDLKDTLKSGLAVINTMPLWWRVEERK